MTNSLIKKRNQKKKAKRKAQTQYIETHYIDDHVNQTKISSVADLKQLVRMVRGRRKLGKRTLRYGIDPNEYDMLMEVQQHSCAICREKFITTPHIDHCHTTNKVRALLCFRCNTGLGMFRDNVEYLTNAVKYLTAFKGSDQ